MSTIERTSPAAQAATPTAQAVVLSNVGPISRLSIPLPAGGGVVVLRGPNGSGKSHGIDAVSSLSNRATRTTLTRSDGTREGSIEGLGVNVRLGKANTAKGELVCETLDPACDPSVFVDPGVKDPEAADKKRLATLVRLLDIQVTFAQWGDLFAGAEHLRELVDLGTLADVDPVTAADKIRRRLNECALLREREADKQNAEAEGLAQSVADVPKVESDKAAVDAACAAASQAVAEAKQARMARANAEKVAAESRARLETLGSEPGGSVAEAAEYAESMAYAVQVRSELVEDLRHRLKMAESDLAGAAAEERIALTQLSEAKRRQAIHDEARAAVDRAIPDAPSDEALAALEAAEVAANEARVNAQRVGQANKLRGTALSIRETAATIAKDAAKLRDMAKGTDRVLEKAVALAGISSQLAISEGRLCAVTDRGFEPISELSHGERWRLALDFAAKALSRGGLLTCCQEAWESLDPHNRTYVSNLARERGLTIITAEAAAGELRAEAFTPAEG